MIQLKNKTTLSLILIFSIFALITAYFIQYILGHKPCNLCLIERLPYISSIILALLSLILKKFEKIIFILLALIFISATIISFYHFGIEQGFFQESLVCNSDNEINNLNKEDLLKDLQSEMNMAIMMITHDLGVIADLADEIMVMYAGQIVETGSPDHIFYEYQHPYSQGLLASIPQMGSTRTAALPSISGTVPSTLHLPDGCSFLPRCKYATDQCTEAPAMSEVEPSHFVRCWHRDELVR